MKKLIIILTLLPFMLESYPFERLPGEAERQDYVITYQDSDVKILTNKKVRPLPKKIIILENIFDHYGN